MDKWSGYCDPTQMNPKTLKVLTDTTVYSSDQKKVIKRMVSPKLMDRPTIQEVEAVFPSSLIQGIKGLPKKSCEEET